MIPRWSQGGRISKKHQLHFSYHHPCHPNANSTWRLTGHTVKRLVFDGSEIFTSIQENPEKYKVPPGNLFRAFSKKITSVSWSKIDKKSAVLYEENNTESALLVWCKSIENAVLKLGFWTYVPSSCVVQMLALRLHNYFVFYNTIYTTPKHIQIIQQYLNHTLEGVGVFMLRNNFLLK